MRAGEEEGGRREENCFIPRVHSPTYLPAVAPSFFFFFSSFFRGHNGLFFLSSLLASRASGLIMFAPEARQCAFVVKSRARDYSMDLVSFGSRCQHVL